MCTIPLNFNRDALLYSDSQRVLDSSQSPYYLQNKCFRFETETQTHKHNTQQLCRKKPQNSDPSYLSETEKK